MQCLALQGSCIQQPRQSRRSILPALGSSLRIHPEFGKNAITHNSERRAEPLQDLLLNWTRIPTGCVNLAFVATSISALLPKLVTCTALDWVSQCNAIPPLCRLTEFIKWCSHLHSMYKVAVFWHFSQLYNPAQSEIDSLVHAWVQSSRIYPILATSSVRQHSFTPNLLCWRIPSSRRFLLKRNPLLSDLPL